MNILDFPVENAFTAKSEKSCALLRVLYKNKLPLARRVIKNIALHGGVFSLNLEQTYFCLPSDIFIDRCEVWRASRC